MADMISSALNGVVDASVSSWTPASTDSSAGGPASPGMDRLIAQRVEDIRQAHASNLIEGQDMGAAALDGMLERARAPISDDEFVRRERALWLLKYTRRA